ncbi:Os04g0403600 [Oryza sativa Japonica Group]|uniref:Uncharacterized protein n=5 Tax=Oryza TaxID=4527 RepID=A0A8J8XRF2_ORYSJ|nr:hypothetical protein OsI_15759 [Oryza sativa Indica Group]EAZ30621.1 hypothetical protein OsJ_14673 [Oryza sativa Japonica Group]BAF14614.2 Os04g0403600 [Oryza sativa Japonica Group]BAS89061.1 Os04g0403600 [Oryza sativa Japonica Group]|eukprot:NP_001052700.2 Os04g0403600 [Oryza sativa Japonica Group]
MEVFIHEDYVNKRNEVRREQRRKQLQMEQALAGVSPPAPEPRESPRVPAQCLTLTGGPSTTVGSPTASATAAEAAETVGHRLFDCLKPY